MTEPTDDHGLSFDDLAREAARFGVANAQVERDHVISHMLAAIARHLRDDVLFIGGTALSRTHLVHARLSEDIDLIAVGPRAGVARRLTAAIDGALIRTHGRVTWAPVFGSDDVQPAVATVAGMSVKVQLLSNTGYARWPTERIPVEQRYRDAPPASLTVPTLAAFAAWKMDVHDGPGGEDVAGRARGADDVDHHRCRRPARRA